MLNSLNRHPVCYLTLWGLREARTCLVLLSALEGIRLNEPIQKEVGIYGQVKSDTK